ncbi:MAG: DNA-J related domain-containing protein [Rheinheimera sp.]|nr:DNA-J related domain-containing protein [Rheinheimera sp.]
MTCYPPPLTDAVLQLLKGQLNSLILAYLPAHSIIEEQYLLRRLGLKLQQDTPISADLALFQQHFVLYHLLYRLQHDLLQCQQGYLHIELATVQYLPLAAMPAMPGDNGRRDYYLNWRHYYAMTEQLLDEQLNAFWQFVSARRTTPAVSDLSSARALLALPDEFSLAQLKKAYRTLALQQHPDRGGDEQDFIVLTAAYQMLLQQF